MVAKSKKTKKPTDAFKRSSTIECLTIGRGPTPPLWLPEIPRRENSSFLFLSEESENDVLDLPPRSFE